MYQYLEQFPVALLLCGLYSVTSIPAACSTNLTHLDMVSLETGL